MTMPLVIIVIVLGLIYLAAGSPQGLRPMRYEKRVARNRFIVLAVVFLAAMWGILVMLFRSR